MNDSLKIKIGQMIMAGIPGGCVTESFAELCREYRIGNFCLSAENAVSLEDICDMNAELRKMTFSPTFPSLTLPKRA